MSCNHPTGTLFKKVSYSESGITFNNTITENDSINPLDLEFLYNGGGVAVGDFNNDRLPDLYFTASTVANQLYLNKGNLQFTDVTAASNTSGEGRWCNAASVVDINNDGWQDIYVCATIKKNPEQRRNLLYINLGVNNDGVPVFKEMANAYNLDDSSFSVQAAFFDYDNDGDLDMYLLTTKLAERDATQFLNKNNTDTSKTDIDKLFRNDWNDSLQHPLFTDVSGQAGILEHGYGLGLAIADINKDGWKDMYVTNDFFGSDLLYINNHNGTFTNKVNEYFKHTSQNAMGNDVADINNDGLADIIAVDMNPEDNFRKKKNMNSSNYFLYQSMVFENYTLQYVRNTLQLNQGPVVKANDSISDPVFSDISFLAGVAETDWSWNPSLADFDNDGLRDIIITNGYPRDVTDHDFAAFRQHATANFNKQQLIDQIPQIKVANYAFKNNDSLRFVNVTKDWGMDEPSFSCGAVYADLDRDGDLDYVISNINEVATLYENNTNARGKINANFLELSFKGGKKNINGLGAVAEIYYEKNRIQVYENSPYRGYLSTVDNKAFFGLGKATLIDSLILRWPGGKEQRIKNVTVNAHMQVNISNAEDTGEKQLVPANDLFTDITELLGINYRHQETDFIDFNEQRLLPHKLSQYGPGLAAGDIDGNGLDDLVVGGTGDYAGIQLMQQKDGKFISKPLPPVTGNDIRRPENMGILLFDADNDADPDLYLASGSNEFAANTKNYQDQFFINDGKGNFSFTETALPQNYTSKSCVKAADIDNDGDLDLFIGGRVLPGKYPMPVSSFIYRNDSKPGNIRFTDVSNEVAIDLKDIGLVCDAIWTDFDNDNQVDLIVVGEWMPLTFFKNNKGKFENITDKTGLLQTEGWWNSIAGGDFDNDGDIDYIAGNLGKNSYYRTVQNNPVSIYAKDFDKNGGYDNITTLYLKNEYGQLIEFPAQNRDEIVEQLPVLKKRFLTYKEFGRADIKALFTPGEMKDGLIRRAYQLNSCYIENLGNGKFSIRPLPVEAQMAPLYGMVVHDFNKDGNLDAAITGNDFGTEVTNGRYDALNGLLLLGNGHGGFSAKSILNSGLYIPGDGKAMVQLAGVNNSYLLATSQNRAPLKVFKNKKMMGSFSKLHQQDRYISYQLKNGKTRKEELYFGHSFLSQSTSFIFFDKEMYLSVSVTDNKGVKRSIE
ncbi:MAG: VCBS repeat-containing protein [Chitinophagaceae bacterium]